MFPLDIFSPVKNTPYFNIKKFLFSEKNLTSRDKKHIFPKSGKETGFQTKEEM